MQITLIVNPRSGRGKALDGAHRLGAELGRRGHTIRTFEMGEDRGVLRSVISDADRVVILGGDGTVHHLLPILAEAQTPMYHFGTGTANLISKEFGMTRSPSQVADDLELAHDPIRVDLPTCNGYPFLIMLSMGIDASIIHRFEKSRSRLGGYRAYIQPVLREVISPRPARFIVEHRSSNNHAKKESHTGVLVVANLRSYACGVNPCPRADPSDGRLDATVIPCATSLAYGIRFGMLRFGRTPRVVKRCIARSFRIGCSERSAFVQVDGEKASKIPGLNHGMLELGDSLEIAIGQQQILIHPPNLPTISNVR